MTREQQRRQEWEARIPESWGEMLLISDVHRAINRGLPVELVSLSTLHRWANGGNGGAIGGPGTGVHKRFRRSELIEHLVKLDVTLADRAERGPPTPKAKRAATAPTRQTVRRAKPVPSQQPSLFDQPDEEGS